MVENLPHILWQDVRKKLKTRSIYFLNSGAKYNLKIISSSSLDFIFIHKMNVNRNYFLINIAFYRKLFFKIQRKIKICGHIWFWSFRISYMNRNVLSKKIEYCILINFFISIIQNHFIEIRQIIDIHDWRKGVGGWHG